MTRAKKHRFSGIVLAKALVGILATAWLCAAQESPPALQITSPADGSVVNPWQTITVTVTSPANGAFTHVAVVGEDPIGFSSIATSVPAQFSMTVPTDIACRTYMLTADGTTASGQNAQSATILIDVERPDLPASLSALLPQIIFEAQGEQSPIVLLATFSDGSILDVTQSSNVVYSSSNTSVATVDPTGSVTAFAAGSTSITATYGQGPPSVSVNIPVTVPPPVLAASPASLSFDSQNIGSSSGSQPLTLTNVANGAISILGVSATGDFSETDNCVSSLPLAPSSTCTINVIFTPTSTGPRTGAVRITNSFTIVSIAFPLTGTGVGVTKQPTLVVVASSGNPSVFGQSVTLTATVSPASGSGTPTGTVTFMDGSSSIGMGTVSAGQATLTTPSLAVGSHSITAAYSGDGAFLGSTSGTLNQTVNKPSTNTTVSSSVSPSILNQAVTFTAGVSVLVPGSGTPTGTVTFQEGSTVLATVPLSASGSATFSTSSLAVASHSISAVYSGDGNFIGSSGSVTQNVSYAICVLYDQTKSVNSGATFPIKLYLCDVSGNDVSSSTIVLHATQVTNVSGFSGDVTSPGNANPDNDFRFDATLGPTGGYIFNLSTAGLASGTYSLQFTAGTDAVNHGVNFGVK